jgi:NitT/TauT family transport system substrate-binding protein
MATLSATLSAQVALGFTPEGHKLILGLQSTGTAKWELAAMSALGIDKKHGLELTVKDLADAKAGQIALQAKEVEIILSDFVWVNLQRHQGNKMMIVPHSLTVGGLLVDPAAGIASVADLKGKTLAVSGSSVDKSFVILSAYYAKQTGGKLADDADIKFGAPPLINELFTGGQAQAALNLWNWNARAKVAGKTELISVPAMLADLGVSATPPLLGWVFSEEMATERKADFKAFLDASFETKKALATDDAIWTTIRDAMNVDSDELFIALRDAYRAGIVLKYSFGEMQPAAEAFALMAQYGGADVVGEATTLDEGTFWKGYRK